MLFYKLLDALVTEIRFAFIIAFTLHITVELHAKIEYDKQISRDFLPYIYNINIDNDMFLLAEKHMLKAPFLRKNFQIEYDFLSLNNDIFKIKYTVEYIVENVSGTERDYIIRTFVEIPADSENLNLEGDQGLHRIIVDGKIILQDELDSIKSNSSGNLADFVVSEHKITLLPGQNKRIECIYLLEKFIQDSELWHNVVHCSGVSLKIRRKPEFNISMVAYSIHTDDIFESINTDQYCTLSENLFQPFFPHNGVHFWWAPKGR